MSLSASKYTGTETRYDAYLNRGECNFRRKSASQSGEADYAASEHLPEENFK